MKTSLLSPLNLRARLKKPNVSLVDVFSMLSVFLAAAMLYTMSSTYIFAPGLTLDLEASQENSSYVLPVGEGPLPGVPVGGVFTMRNDHQFLYDGQIFSSVQAALPPQAAGTTIDRGALLVKIDRAVTVQGLFEIVDAAKAAGFTKIQLAGEEKIVKK